MAVLVRLLHTMDKQMTDFFVCIFIPRWDPRVRMF